MSTTLGDAGEPTAQQALVPPVEALSELDAGAGKTEAEQSARSRTAVALDF